MIESRNVVTKIEASAERTPNCRLSPVSNTIDPEDLRL